jgi:hypothetical protein
MVDRLLACAAAAAAALSLLRDLGSLDRREVSLGRSLEEAREDGAGDGATAGTAGTVGGAGAGGGGGGGGSCAAGAGATGR